MAAYAERGAARQKGRREDGGRWSAAGDREANGIAIYASGLSLSLLSLSLRSAAASVPASLLMCLCFCLLPGWLCPFPCVSLALGCAYAEQGGCCAWLRATTRYGGGGAETRRGTDGRGQMAWLG